MLKEVNGVLVPVALHRGGNSNARLYRGCNFGTLISEILKCLSGQPYSSCMYGRVRMYVCVSICVCVMCVYVCINVGVCERMDLVYVCDNFKKFSVQLKNTFFLHVQYPVNKRSKQY